MIDERHEELASLYALDLLEGAERAQFETALARDPELQALVRELATHDDLYLVCGRYEGVDERVAAHLVNREISIGDYILTGWELPAMVIIDAVSRREPDVPGSIGLVAHAVALHVHLVGDVERGLTVFDRARFFMRDVPPP